MRALLLLALLVGCGDNRAGNVRDDAGVGDAGTDAPSGALAPCLDRPTDLPTAPRDQLPCDLLPPGFGAP